VLDQPTVSRFHAQIELGEDGLVCIQDTDSKNGTFLNRNDCWIRVRRVTMCIGDRIRFGDCEVPLENLTAVFGNRSGARLGAKSFPLLSGKTGARLFADLSDRGSLLSRPRRNPATGKIEDDHAG
jgi:pSer/pThr/pTyr-binding forkhead associated (FHA) protein